MWQKTEPKGLGEFRSQEGRRNLSTSKECLGWKVWNWAEASGKDSNIIFISLEEATGSRLKHGVRTILPF